MSNQPISTTGQVVPDSAAKEQGAAAERQPLFPIAGSWRIAMVGAIIMILLSLLGVAITRTSREMAPTYWISLVPIFGFVCIGVAWARARHFEGMGRAAVVRQLFHWLGIGVALSLDFLIRSSSAETGEAAGLNALLVLALGCYLAGVHLEWIFAVVGVLLTLTLIVIAKAEQYVWLIFVVGIVSIAVMFYLQRFFAARRPLSAKS